ncbi:HD domain-containing protein [Patescibacteria group bacterium]
MNKEDAISILEDYVESESLRKHCQAVAACMKHFAKKHNEDGEKWEITGILHDFDYEKFPENHPMAGEEILKEKGVAEDIIRAIQSHANWSNVSRDSLMEKILYAVDELSGFVVAVAYVRPNKMEGMKVKSVKKKLKDKSFAAKVNREEIKEAAEELGVELGDLIQDVIEALTNEAENLGLK